MLFPNRISHTIFINDDLTHINDIQLSLQFSLTAIIQTYKFINVSLY